MTGFGLIAGSAGKDFIETLFYGMAFMIPLMIPAIAVLFPGSAAVWVKILPSYGLVQAVVQSSAYNAGWLEVLPHLGTGAGVVRGRLRGGVGDSQEESGDAMSEGTPIERISRSGK